MGLEIHLLGSPRVVRDGVPQPAPPGHKVWGLLAYLLLRDKPADRTHVAGLLFPTADDPMAALRWALTMLRRFVGEAATVEGDPLTVTRTGPVTVDVLALRTATPDEAGAYGDLGADLLAGLAFPGCPSFEIWLEAQRRHTRGTVESLLHEAALARLARGDADGAADLASRVVALDPYDENHQVLLVRSLAAGGHGVEAARAAAACRALFRAELGVEPSAALDAAMVTITATPTAGAVTGRPAVVALLEAGSAAIGAGALEAGLQVLRRAVADAMALGDEALTARVLAALGSALVRAGRGSDEEGATALHRTLVCSCAEPETLSFALSELAYVEFLRGRYGRVEVWLGQAEAVVQGGGDPEQRAAALTVRGSTASDQGRYGDARCALEEALGIAKDERRRAYVTSMIGRLHLLRGELDTAAEALDASIALAGSAGWATFVPWPESLRAEVDLRRDDVAGAQRRLEHAFALGCQVGDPCWEGMSARGLGLVRAARGDVEGAVETLLDAERRATRLPDGYVWARAYILDALAGVGVEAGLAGTRRWVADLAAVSEHSGMVELCARAALHRWRLGDEGALGAARALGASVDNPVLTALLWA